MNTAQLLDGESLASRGEPALAAADLWRRFQQDRANGALEEELVYRYLPLVKAAVGRIAMSLPAHVDMGDLHSAGLVGLLNAIRHFDLHGGAAFETYARLRIRGAVLDELRRLDWQPRSAHTKARKIQTALQELEGELGRAPSTAEIAQRLEISVPQYEQWLVEVRPATFVCLDSVAGEEGGEGESSLHELIADPRQDTPERLAQRQEYVTLITEGLGLLPEMQRKVLALYYYEGLLLREIAELLHLTESRICQIHAQAILALKARLMQSEACPNQPAFAEIS